MTGLIERIVDAECSNVKLGLVQKIEPILGSNVSNLVEHIVGAYRSDVKLQILGQVLERNFIKLMYDGTWNGIDYEVVDPSQNQKIVGYLVGTYHRFPTDDLLTKEYAILERCKELIEEVPGIKVGIDFYLAKHAKEKHIPIIGLATPKQQSAILEKLRMINSKDRFSYQAFNVRALTFLTENPLAIKRGDEVALVDLHERFRTKNSREYDEAALYQRNRIWAFGSENAVIKEGLIGRFRQGSTPICVAVGAAHLYYGAESLVRILRNSGFIVNRI